MNTCKCRAVLLIALLLLPNVAASADTAREGFVKGKTSLEKGEYDAAITAFTEIIRIDPKCAAAYYDRGTAYNLKGVADFVGAIRQHLNVIKAYDSAEENFINANADFTKGMCLDPRVADVYYGCRVAYTQQGDWLADGAMHIVRPTLPRSPAQENPNEKTSLPFVNIPGVDVPKFPAGFYLPLIESPVSRPPMQGPQPIPDEPTPTR